MDGIYLPLLFDAQQCQSDPVAMSFHSSHFACLAPLSEEPLPAGEHRFAAPFPAAVSVGELEQVLGLNEQQSTAEASETRAQVSFEALLPLQDAQQKPLPVHFATTAELSDRRALLQRYMQTRLNAAGQLLAVQNCRSPSSLPSFMLSLLSTYLSNTAVGVALTASVAPPKAQLAPCKGGCGFMGSSESDG
jgi:hypothetical protein